jgi:hypothetical protein
MATVIYIPTNIVWRVLFSSHLYQHLLFVFLMIAILMGMR